ncbi:MAG: hypothetical protein HOV80_20105 [Polyangiaceae bacterium]|nr:hypothetical protein [Polyangiaceae bacterium]
MVRARIAAAVAAAAFAVPAIAAAEPLTATLRVERTPGAESCPDADALRRDVEALAGAPIFTFQESPEVDISVRVVPNGDGFRAVVVAKGARTGERTLDDSGPGCDVLARGLVVILALMVDAPLDTPRESDKRRPLPSWESSAKYILPEVPPTPEDKPAQRFPPLMGSIGPLYATGVLPSDAAGLKVSFEGYLPLVSFGASVVWIPEDSLEQTPASFSYVGARARTCARQPDLEQYGIAACLRFGAGLRSAELGEGKEPLDAANGPYIAFGGELEISRRIVGPFGVYADLGLDVAVVADPLELNYERIHVAPEDSGIAFDTGVGIRFWLQPEEPEPASD